MGMFAYTYTREEHPRDIVTPCHAVPLNVDGSKHGEVLPFSEYYMNAVWDTGAHGTAISSGLIKHLGLKPIGGKKTIISANGEYQSDLYTIDLYLSEDVVFRNLIVSELKTSAFDILIGLDIILQGDFVIEPHGETYTFKFRHPAEGNQDIFVKPYIMKTYAELLKEQKG